MISHVESKEKKKKTKNRLVIAKGKEWKVGNVSEGDQKFKMSNSKIVKRTHSQQKS